MEKKKGFTLIELLAVIVILALIALIAIPLIMSVVESSKKGAYEESLRNLIKGAEYYETSEKILGRDVDFSNGISVLENHIEMNNKNFKTGIIKKNESGEFYLENVSDGNYCAFGTIDNLVISKGNCEGVEPPIIDTTFTFASIMTDEKAGKNGSIHMDMRGNKRYAGENPNNYVCFGIQGDTCDEEHLYRMIGVIDGKMKIVKVLYYSDDYRWDSTGGEYGSSDWGRPADLKEELNGSSFFYNTKYIDKLSRGYVSNATWYTGGVPYESKKNYLFKFEEAERNESTVGYIGLISVTDFVYASNGECDKMNTDLYTADNACMKKNWLFDNNLYQWTITPEPSLNGVWIICYPSGGNVVVYYPFDTYGVRPSLFLNSSVKIKSGEGTKENPYILTT